MTLADMIQEYLNQQGKDLTDEQRSAIDLLASQYPNQCWTVKEKEAVE